MKSLTIVEVQPAGADFHLKEVSRHFATIWSSAVTTTDENQWLLADMEGNLTMLRRDPQGPTADDRRRLQVTGEFRLGEVVNRIQPIASPSPTDNTTSTNARKGKERSRTLSSSHHAALDASYQATSTNGAPPGTTRATRNGPLITPRAFLATVEGAIYLHGTINPAYLDVLLRLQRPLAERVQAPGLLPWAAYRGVKTMVREAEEPFRFVDGEVLEQGLLGLGDEVLEGVLRDAGLVGGEGGGGFGVTVEEVRGWGEELRRLY
jgi:DNA damage-binding protein 1